MLILFDHVTPTGVARCLAEHTVVKAKERGWDTLTNGELLSVAEKAGFEKIAVAVDAATPGSYTEVQL